MYHYPRRLLVGLSTLLLGASTAAADTTASLDGWPAWVRDAMTVEAKDLEYRSVTAPHDSVHSKLPGKPGAPRSIEDGWYFTSDIGAESPLECYLFTSSRDLATLTDVIAEANIEAVAGSTDNVGTRQVFHTDAGEVAGLPYLALEWLYTIERDDQVLIGFTKVRAATKGESAFVCTHNYLGYRDTLARAFTEFVGSTAVTDDTPEPFYEEIARLDLSGLGTGIAYVSYTNDDDGSIRMYTAEASIMPVDAATVATSDSYTISLTSPDGELLNAYQIGVENGEITSNMSLDRNDEGTWISGGTLQGKELAYEIDGASQPTSEWQQLAMARNLFTGDDTSISARVWMPSIDPTQFLDAKMTRDDADVAGQALLTLGPLSYTGRFDESGNLFDASMAIGPVTIDIERIWSRGSVMR
ncbi:MAG: hypothetical protein P8Y01_01480 [Woeseiaceae bacterium]